MMLNKSRHLVVPVLSQNHHDATNAVTYEEEMSTNKSVVTTTIRLHDVHSTSRTIVVYVYARAA